MKIWLKRISVPILLVLATLVSVFAATLHESKSCCICRHTQCDAPCILNVSTGELGELELFPPYLGIEESSEKLTGGTFSFIKVAGLTGIKLTEPWYIELSVPMTGDTKNEQYFCEGCEELLREFAQGYVLIDLYNMENPIAYDITCESVYTIRGYSIKVSRDSRDGYLKLRLDGELYNALDKSAEQ